jgi:hypothetical protein
MNNLLKGPPLDRLQWVQGIAIGIPARNQVGAEAVFRKAQDGPSQILIGYNGVAGPNPGIGRRHHHRHYQLTQIEVENLLLPLALHHRSSDGHDGGRIGDVPGAAPDLAEL